MKCKQTTFREKERDILLVREPGGGGLELQGLTATFCAEGKRKKAEPGASD